MTTLKRQILGTVVVLVTVPTLLLAEGGSLPMRVIVNEVEPAAEEQRVATPGYRRIIANPERLRSAIDAQERHMDALLYEASARGTGVGWDDNDNPVIKVYVDDSTALPAIPERLDGIPVQIEYTGPLYALNIACEDRDDNCRRTPDPDIATVSPTSSTPGASEYHPRPVPIGVSAGHINITAGTIGCRVTAGCHTFALSNAHVFADENSGVVGDNILQPGPFDGGINPTDSIGTLADSVPIVIGQFANNRVDAAIAAVSAFDVDKSTLPGGYGTPKTDPLTASVGLDVQKFGRTSAMTYGYVDAVNVAVLVTYDAGDARFIGQIIIKPDTGANFSLPGDSGALVVADGGSNDRRPVGLLFASGTGISVANPISDVLSQLDIDIDGE